MERQKWEYKQIVVSPDTDQSRGSILNRLFVDNHWKMMNRLGWDGWELVSGVPINDGGNTEGTHLYFKRPKMDKAIGRALRSAK